MRKQGVACAAFAAILALSSCAGGAERLVLADSWTELGNSWAEKGDWAKASDAWSRALVLDPEQGVAAANLARAYAEAGRYNEALSALEDALERDPGNAGLLSIKAFALAKLGRPAEAIALYGQVVELRAADRVSLFNLGLLLEDAGRYEEALERYRAILSANPGEAASLLRAATALIALGRTEEAIQPLDDYAGSLESADAEQIAVAGLWESAGLYARGMATVAAYLEKNTTDASAWFALGRLRIKAGTPAEEAIEALKRAKAAGFKDSDAVQDLAELPGISLNEETQALLKSFLQ